MEKKRHDLVNWKEVCQLKDLGGLEIIPLKEMKQVLLRK